MTARIPSFSKFYDFYLNEHRNMWTRIFHFAGTFTIIVVLIYVIYSGKERFLWYIPILGYGLAWLSHAIFEKKLPATIKYPVWTLAADFKLFFDLLTGKQKFKSQPETSKHTT